MISLHHSPGLSISDQLRTLEGNTVTLNLTSHSEPFDTITGPLIRKGRVYHVDESRNRITTTLHFSAESILHITPETNTRHPQIYFKS